MSFQKITKDNIETFTLRTNPYRTFSSSSNGVTGSVYIFARRSPSEKEMAPLPTFMEASHNDSNLENLLSDLKSRSRNKTNILDEMKQYLSGVNAQGSSARKNKVLDVIRFTPSFNFGLNTQRKLTVKNTLNPFYRHIYPTYQWATTNYYCLNFFTASSVPSSSVLIYPDDLSKINPGLETGSYVLPDEFSFDFYIKPKYTNDHPGASYKAGTIMHVSSCYAVSLITGSSRTIKGYVDGYRLCLQLSHSADVKPSLAIPGNYPKDLVFWSNDNSLKKDTWHHVIIRWGTSTINDGTGSFIIDGKQAGTFVIPSSSVAPKPFVNSLEPSALFVGNFYEGKNYSTDAISMFFAAKPAEREGLTQLDADTSQDEPYHYMFNHQLNAETHDLAIKRYYMTDRDIEISASRGPDTSFHKIVFYLPPFFTKDSPYRKFVGSSGGVLQTPFFSVDGTTDDPYNVAMSFGVGGHYMNLENFTYDFAGQKWPRLLNLSASEYQNTVASASSANTLLYDFSATSLRNLLMMPCDDGRFFPNYEVLALLGSNDKFVDDLGVHDYAWISLDNMVSTSTIRHAISEESGSFMSSIAGPSPGDAGLESGATYTILQRTKDPSSNQVAFFDISNLYYGNRIKPGTLSIIDSGLTGSRDKVSVVLKDDGNGNVFRADSDYPATWNSVGNVYYNEGIIAIKSPNLFFFGKDQFEISFQGEQNIHTMKINVLAASKDYNSSSNPSFLPVSASAYDNDPEKRFVYISNVNLHDDNFNIIGKTQLAQPVLKRYGDKFMFRIKVDF